MCYKISNLMLVFIRFQIQSYRSIFDILYKIQIKVIGKLNSHQISQYDFCLIEHLERYFYKHNNMLKGERLYRSQVYYTHKESIWFYKIVYNSICYFNVWIFVILLPA